MLATQKREYPRHTPQKCLYEAQYTQLHMKYKNNQEFPLILNVKLINFSEK